MNEAKLNIPACLFDVGDSVFVTARPGDLFKEDFQGTVRGFKQGVYVTVVDQDDNAWDCDWSQVESLTDAE